jgi:hypothetical protein
VKLPVHFLAGICVLACAAPPARAQDNLGTPNGERFRMSAGIFSFDTETDVRVDADDGTEGTEVSGEEDLGLRDHSDVGDVEVEMRIRERHRVRFDYFKVDREASQALERQIVFGNDTYNVGDVVDSAIDMRNFGVTYMYELARKERYVFAWGLGVNLLELNTSAEVDARSISEEESIAGPGPVIGIQTLVRFTDRIHSELRAEYMEAHSKDFRGSITNLHGTVVYRFNRSIGAGVGYKLFEIDADSESTGDTGRFAIKNSGPLAFVRVTF